MPCQTLIAPLLKCVSDSTADAFFVRKGAFYLNISSKKDSTKEKISDKTLEIWDTLFKLVQIEVQCSKNYFKISLSQEAGASGNNTENEQQKPPPKLKKCKY